MILIISYGNSLRRDDGAGHKLADTLEAMLHARQIDVERLSTQQLVPELAADIAKAGVSAVVFVDTRVVSEQETQPRIRIEPLVVDTTSPSVGHHLNTKTLLLYASHLYGKKLPAWQLTIPGIDFDHGEGFSAFTQAALSEADQQLSESVDPIFEEPASSDAATFGI